MEKIACAIIGSGNIGMNLLYKIRRSRVLECSLFVGRNDMSTGLWKIRHPGWTGKIFCGRW